MVHGLLIRKGDMYYTHLKKILQALGEEQKDWNWSITNHECYPKTAEFEERFSENRCWISGKELSDIIDIEDFQWIWGIFSAFPQTISNEEALDSYISDDSAYNVFYNIPSTMPNAKAKVTIAAVDSSETIILTEDDTIYQRLSTAFPQGEFLDYYNYQNSNTAEDVPFENIMDISKAELRYRAPDGTEKSIDLNYCAKRYDEAFQASEIHTQKKILCVGVRSFYGEEAFFLLFAQRPIRFRMKLRMNPVKRFLAKHFCINSHTKQFAKFYDLQKKLNQEGFTTVDLT